MALGPQVDPPGQRVHIGDGLRQPGLQPAGGGQPRECFAEAPQQRFDRVMQRVDGNREVRVGSEGDAQFGGAWLSSRSREVDGVLGNGHGVSSRL